MKQYECLVPGCNWHTASDNEAEIVARATEHLRNIHAEQAVRPEMVAHIKQRIHEKQAAE
jgi:predicted small metal-binding protein